MFPLSRKATVRSINSPFVSSVYENVAFTCVNHRFYSKNHTGNEKHTGSAFTNVANERFFVELYAYAVTAKFFYNTVAVFFSKCGNCSANVTNSAPSFSSFNTAFQTFFSNINKLFSFGIYFANHKHTGSVCIVTIINGRNVYVYNVTAFEHVIFAGNTVANLVIDGSANTFRETAETKGSRSATLSSSVVINNLVDFSSGHTSFNVFSHFVQNFSVNFASFTDAFDLLRSFNHIFIGNFKTLCSIFFNFIPKLLIHFVSPLKCLSNFVL